MRMLGTLTSIQTTAIAAALNAAVAPPPVTSPPATDGATLYANNCSGCHGVLATSAKLGRTAAQITAAISSVSAMSALSTLTSAQITAMATALSPAVTPPPVISPTDGPTLYGYYCAACHRPLATSSVRRSSASRITSAINGGVSQMSSLRILTSTMISAIATALNF